MKKVVKTLKPSAIRAWNRRCDVCLLRSVGWIVTIIKDCCNFNFMVCHECKDKEPATLINQHIANNIELAN